MFATPMHFDGHTYGYVRLVNFSQKAEVEMRKAIAQLQVGVCGVGEWVVECIGWLSVSLHVACR